MYAMITRIIHHDKAIKFRARFEVVRETLPCRLMKASEQRGHGFNVIVNAKVRRSSHIYSLDMWTISLVTHGRNQCTETFTVIFMEPLTHVHAVDTSTSLPSPSPHQKTWGRG